MADAPAVPSGIVVRTARVVPAPAADAYRAWTDPQSLQQWWGTTGHAKLIEAEVDARPGGRFRFAMQNAAGTTEAAEGQFLEVAPRRQLRFSWSAQCGGVTVADSTVTVEFSDLNDGTTRIVVTHQGLPTPTAATLHQAGWSDMIQDLSIHLSR
jgi:uncharacterized protein YndB with AHSA1/START domain